jgi:hypothetical protein
MRDDPTSAEDDGIMGALGAVVMLWACVDEWLGALAGHLLEANPGLFHVVSNNVSASTVTDWLRTLLHAHEHPDGADKADLDLLATVDGLRAERNALIHGLWQPGIESGIWTVQTIRLERAEIIKNEVVTLADLEELTIAIREAKKGIEALGQRLGYPPMIPGAVR